MIPPFRTMVVKGIANLTTHSKCLNVAVKPVMILRTHYYGHIILGIKTRERQD